MALANNRYRSICAELERRIRGGVYLPGDALPSRFELMEEFSVARATVDRCISELRKKHLVESRHGKGTFVCEGIDCRRYHIAWIGNMICNGLLPAWWRADILPESAFTARSDWGKLAEYDGIIWSMPGGKLLPAIRECQGQVPQVVMNRTYPGIACVSTDHRGAYYEIGLERLRALPESQVYLLRTGYLNSAPEEYRQTGFLDACRQEQRFYEILTMPDDFEGKLAVLERLSGTEERPLLLFSTTCANTGAVMCFARSRGYQWQNDIFYSDFDNEYPDHVWGTLVTSYVQDYRELTLRSIQTLQEQMDGGEPDRVPEQTLIFPQKQNGGT